MNNFLKNVHATCEKPLRNQACNNRSRKELFSIRTKLSYNKIISENLLAIEMKKQILMNKPVCLGLSTS